MSAAESAFGLSWIAASVSTMFLAETHLVYLQGLIEYVIIGILLFFFLLLIRQGATIESFAKFFFFFPGQRKFNAAFVVFCASTALWTLMLAFQTRHFTMEVEGLCARKNASVLWASNRSRVGSFVVDPPVLLGPFAHVGGPKIIEHDVSGESSSNSNELEEEEEEESKMLLEEKEEVEKASTAVSSAKTHNKNTSVVVKCIITIDRASFATLVSFVLWGTFSYLAFVTSFGYLEPFFLRLDDEQFIRESMAVILLEMPELFSVAIASAFVSGIVTGGLQRVLMLVFSGGWSDDVHVRFESIPLSIITILTHLHILLTVKPVAPLSLRSCVVEFARDLQRVFGNNLQEKLVGQFDTRLAELGLAHVAAADGSFSAEACSLAKCLTPLFCLEGVAGRQLLFAILFHGMRLVVGTSQRRVMVPRTLQHWTSYLRSSRHMLQILLFRHGHAAALRESEDKIITDVLSGGGPLQPDGPLVPHGTAALTQEAWTFVGKKFNLLGLHQFLDTSFFSCFVPLQPPRGHTRIAAAPPATRSWNGTRIVMALRSFLCDAHSYSLSIGLQHMEHFGMPRLCSVLRENLFLASFETADGVEMQVSGGCEWRKDAVVIEINKEPMLLLDEEVEVAAAKNDSSNCCTTSAPPIRVPSHSRLQASNHLVFRLQQLINAFKIQTISPGLISTALALLQDPNFLFCLRRSIHWARYALFSKEKNNNDNEHQKEQQQQQQQQPQRRVHVFQRREAEARALFDFYPDAVANERLDDEETSRMKAARQDLIFFERLVIAVFAIFRNLQGALVPVFELFVSDPKMRSADAGRKALRVDVIEFLRAVAATIGLKTPRAAATICEAGEFDLPPPPIILKQSEKFQREVANRFEGHRLMARAEVASMMPLLSVAESERFCPLRAAETAAAVDEKTPESLLQERCRAAFRLHVVMTRLRRQDRVTAAFNSACSCSAQAMRIALALWHADGGLFQTRSSASILCPAQNTDSAMRKSLLDQSYALLRDMVALMNNSGDPAAAAAASSSHLNTPPTATSSTEQQQRVRYILYRELFDATAPRTMPDDFHCELVPPEEAAAAASAGSPFQLPDRPANIPETHIDSSIAGAPSYYLMIDEAMQALSSVAAVWRDAGEYAVDLVAARDASLIVAFSIEFLANTRRDVPGGHPRIAQLLPGIVVIMHQMFERELAQRGSVATDEGDQTLFADANFGRAYSAARMRLMIQTCSACAYSLSRAFACSPPIVAVRIADGVANQRNATSILAAVLPGPSAPLREAVLAKSIERPGVRITTAGQSTEGDCCVCLGELCKPPEGDEGKQQQQQQLPMKVPLAVVHDTCVFHLSCAAAFLADSGDTTAAGAGNTTRCPRCTKPVHQK